MYVETRCCLAFPKVGKGFKQEICVGITDRARLECSKILFIFSAVGICAYYYFRISAEQCFLAKYSIIFVMYFYRVHFIYH
jgi:hypothetical protein